MYSISWGTDVGVLGHRRETAREALALAEEHVAADRPNVTITDLTTGHAISMDDLRERAEAEANSNA